MVVKGIYCSTFRFMAVCVFDSKEKEREENSQSKEKKESVLLPSSKKKKTPHICVVSAQKNGRWKQSLTQTHSDIRFSECYPCTPLPFTHLKPPTPPLLPPSFTSDDKTVSALTVFQSGDRTSFWKKITQGTSYRARNLKHPAMCRASSEAPEGARWMPISLLFCRSSSCQQTKLRTHTVCIWRLTRLTVGLG